MANNKITGGNFEREIAKRISLWWNPARDDLVWRTAGSGGRGTVRAKTKRKTAGHCGDLGPTDKSIQPLFDLITFELKKGYPQATAIDLLEWPKRESNERNFFGFVRQAEKAAKNADTPYWVLIHRRRGREITVWFSRVLWRAVLDTGLSQTPRPIVEFRTERMDVVGTTLDGFFKMWNKTNVKQAMRNLKMEIKQ